MSSGRRPTRELLMSEGPDPAQAALGALERASKRVLTAVTDHPAPALLGAFALGFLLARLARKASEGWS
jgi:hypothetical protein